MLRIRLWFLLYTPVLPAIGLCAVHDEAIDISGRYIVVLRPDADLDNHLERIRSTDGDRLKKFDYQYVIGSFKAYAGHFDEALLDQLKHHNKDVLRVEPDQVLTIDLDTRPSLRRQSDAPVCLNLISHRDTDRINEGYVYYRSAGVGTYVYILDTGIYIGHKEFQGRATAGWTAFGLLSGDTIGHGTHVAGLVGGKTFGAAKRTNLISVKVAEKMQARESTLLAGFTWAYNDILRKRRIGKALINVSLSGKSWSVFNDAIDAAYDLGVTTVVSAGNRAQNAGVSWTTKGAIVVASTDNKRRRRTSSSYGEAVTVFAPGEKILSAWIGSASAVRELSGTSQATALVSGVVALLKGRQPLASARVTREIVKRLATTDVVNDTKGSPNLFAYNGSGR